MTQLGAYIGLYSTKLGKIGSCSILSQLMLYVLVLIYLVYCLLYIRGIIMFSNLFEDNNPENKVLSRTECDSVIVLRVRKTITRKKNI